MYRFEKSGESENGSVSPAPCSLSAPGVPGVQEKKPPWASRL